MGLEISLVKAGNAMQGSLKLVDVDRAMQNLKSNNMELWWNVSKWAGIPAAGYT